MTMTTEPAKSDAARQASLELAYRHLKAVTPDTTAVRRFYAVIMAREALSEVLGEKAAELTPWEPAEKGGDL